MGRIYQTADCLSSRCVENSVRVSVQSKGRRNTLKNVFKRSLKSWVSTSTRGRGFLLTAQLGAASSPQEHVQLKPRASLRHKGPQARLSTMTAPTSPRGPYWPHQSSPDPHPQFLHLTWSHGHPRHQRTHSNKNNNNNNSHPDPSPNIP